MMIFKIIIKITIPILIGGCTAIGTTTDTETSGVPYFLPKSLVKIKIDKKTDGFDVSITPELVPDTSSHFVLTHNKNILASDSLCVARTNTGLLQSVQFHTDDKTDDILFKLAEFAAKASFFTVKLDMNSLEDAPKSIEIIGDPGDIEKINDEIKIYYPNLSIKLDYPQKASPRKCSKDSICFSTNIKVPVTVYDGGTPVNAAYVQLVDIQKVGEIKIQRPILAEKVTKIGFVDGLLTSFALKQPSEGLALASLPLDILDAVMGVPANFFSTALGGAFSDKKALLEQQKELADLKSQIRDKNDDAIPGKHDYAPDSNFNLECVKLSKTNE